MIIITNPHFSQYRVSRDSLPTQSSNLDDGYRLQFICTVFPHISSQPNLQYSEPIHFQKYLAEVCAKFCTQSTVHVVQTLSNEKISSLPLSNRPVFSR